MMRKKLFMTVLSCAILLSGCSEGTPVLETTEAETADPLVLAYSEEKYKAPAEYRYNEAGQLVRKIYLGDGQEEEYSYHSNGALQKVTVLFHGETESVVEYDTMGNPVRSLVADGTGELVVESEYTNSYDAQGRLTQAAQLTVYDYLEEETVYWVQQDSYVYFDDGGYEHDWYCYYYYEDGETVPHCHWVKRYNAQGILVKGLQDLDNIHPMMECLEYQTDAYGNPVTGIWTYQYGDSESGSDYICENVYTTDGKLSQVREYAARYGQPDWPEKGEAAMTLESTREYTYDAEGRMIREVITWPDTDYMVIHIWEYDQWGNLTYFRDDPEDEFPDEMEGRYEYKPLSDCLE